MTWNLAILLLFVLVLLVCTAWVFRHGSRSSHLDCIPLMRLVFFALGVILVDALVEWAAADREHVPALTTLAVGGFYFVTACGVWLAGFFFGRWRAAKYRDIITRR
jgi:predicted MFS family arabinose efflux permease